MALKTKTSEAAKAEVEAYLAKVHEPARSTLEKVRTVIRSAAPKAATEAIGYGVPTFRYKGGLVAYAAFKDHCSFFPMDPSVMQEFADELKDFKTSKGTVQFRVDKPLSAALIRKIVRVRVARNEAKTQR